MKLIPRRDDGILG